MISRAAIRVTGPLTKTPAVNCRQWDFAHLDNYMGVDPNRGLGKERGGRKPITTC